MTEPVYTTVIGAVRAVFRGLGLRLDISGVEHVPAAGGAVLTMNHIGYLDFALAGYTLLPRHRRVRFMAKKGVFDHPVAGPLMRGMRHIPVDRAAGARSYLAAVAAARAGEIVGVFPEATISRSFDLKEFKSGAARMAAEAGVPLLPLVQWGSQRVLTKGRPRDLTRGTDIRILVGPALHPARGSDPVAVTAELKAQMQAMLDTARSSYRGRPRSAQDTWWLPASLGGTAPTPEAVEQEEAEARRAWVAARKAEREAARGAGK